MCNRCDCCDCNCPACSEDSRGWWLKLTPEQRAMGILSEALAPPVKRITYRWRSDAD